jgi:hypothetical protein
LSQVILLFHVGADNPRWLLVPRKEKKLLVFFTSVQKKL